MATNSPEKKKSFLRAVTAEKLTEMLKEIDVSAVRDSEGAYTARARIVALFDRGTFCEVGAYINRSSDPDEAEGVICGYGAINGRLAFAFSQDRNRMNGAFDEYSGKKIDAVYQMAVNNNSPIIGIFDSDGVCVYEGVRALSSLGRTIVTSTRADGVIPRIAVIPGVCGGSMASLAAGFDFVITCKDVKGETGTEFYTVSPFVSGKAKKAESERISALTVENEDMMYSEARRLLTFLPSAGADGTVCSPDDADLNRRIDITGMRGEALISVLSDSRNYIRLYENAAPEMVAGFGFFGGIAAAFIANNPAHKDGSLTPAAMNVAAHIQRFAGRFGIPIISLTDCPGFYDDEENISDYPDAAGSLADAFGNYGNAKISAVVGRAYGSGFIYMASKAFGADMAFALPEACISALSPEASVALVWNDRIRAADLSATREMLEREWRDKLASPNEAALSGDIDDIVQPTELRARIVSSLHMLLGRNRSIPSRKGRE